MPPAQLTEFLPDRNEVGDSLRGMFGLAERIDDHHPAAPCRQPFHLLETAVSPYDERVQVESHHHAGIFERLPCSSLQVRRGIDD